MKIYPVTTLLLLLTPILLSEASAGSANELLQQYQSQSSGTFDARRGETLWGQSNSLQGTARSCSSCHGDDLKKAGQHQRTQKTIDPMAPSVNPQRFTDYKKTEKWFKRNCKWTLGRECTLQEKGDLLSFLRQL